MLLYAMDPDLARYVYGRLEFFHLAIYSSSRSTKV